MYIYVYMYIYIIFIYQYPYCSPRGKGHNELWQQKAATVTTKLGKISPNGNTADRSSCLPRGAAPGAPGQADRQTDMPSYIHIYIHTER